MVVDFAGGDLDSLSASQPVQAAITATNGQVDDIHVEHLPETGVWRAAMRVKSGGDKPVELRCYLTLYGEALTETWTYLLNPTS